MIEQDTIKLLRECDAGVKMGVASIDDVLDRVHSEKLRQRLITCKAEHEKLKGEINGLLGQYHDEGKEPNPVAKGMSWMKVGVKMGLDDSDKTVADLMTDGCNMGVKSLIRYRNRYPNASEAARSIAGQLIDSEQLLCKSMQPYL